MVVKQGHASKARFYRYMSWLIDMVKLPRQGSGL